MFEEYICAILDFRPGVSGDGGRLGFNMDLGVLTVVRGVCEGERLDWM